MSNNTNKRKSATENSILKFLTVSSVSSDIIVKGIIDDIINTAMKTAEVDEQKTKYLQVQRVITPTIENDGYLPISFALLYSLLQKRLLTCTLLKLCLTQLLFNKCRMQVECISLFNLTYRYIYQKGT
jgi:hypothetical protein